jgi:BON domain
MAYDEYRERREFERSRDFERGEYGRPSFRRGEESRWPGESSWGYGPEYDEKSLESRYGSGPAREFETEGRPDLTREATESHGQRTRRYGVDRYGSDFGWQPQGGYGQSGGYLYGWSPGEQGFDSRSYRTPRRSSLSYGAYETFSEPVYFYGTARHLASIPRGRFTGRGPKGWRRPDARIEEDVQEELLQNGELDASNITVRVVDCKVTLDGEVDTREEKRLAEDIVEQCPGVQDVDNNLHVKRGFFARLFGLDRDDDTSPARESR